MLKNQEKKLVFNVSIVSLVLCLLVSIPWGIEKISTFEIVMKYIVIPALIIVASIININIKYRNYRPANKFATISSYVPMFSYLVASLFNALMYLSRSLEVYSKTKWMILAFILIVLCVVFATLSHCYYRAVLVFNKNTSMLFDYSFLAITVIDTLLLSFIARDYSQFALEAGSLWHILIPGLLGALVVVLLSFILRNYRDYNDEFKLVDKEPLLENWMKIREETYYNATEEIMNALYDFSASNLEFEEDEEEAEAVEVETVVEVVDSEETLNKLAQLEAEKAEALAAKERAEAEKAEALAAKERAEAEKAEALAKLADLEKENAEKEPEVVTVKDPELEAEMAKLQEENEKHEEEKARLQEENEKFEEEKARLQEENEKHEEEKARLQEEKEATEEEKARLQEELNKREEQDRLEAEEAARAAEAAEAARAEKEAAMAAQYKAIRPTYDKMCQYIDAMEGVRNVPTSSGNKFYIGKKLVAIFQKGKGDYRITFQAKDDKFLEFIKNSTDSVDRATSPKGTNWLKFVNKTVTDEEFVKDILKGAVEYVNDEIAAELAAKEEAKRIKAEEKRKAKEAEKAAKEKEKEKAAKAAAKAKEKAAKEKKAA